MTGALPLSISSMRFHCTCVSWSAVSVDEGTVRLEVEYPIHD